MHIIQILLGYNFLKVPRIGTECKNIIYFSNRHLIKYLSTDIDAHTDTDTHTHTHTRIYKRSRNIMEKNGARS